VTSKKSDFEAELRSADFIIPMPPAIPKMPQMKAAEPNKIIDLDFKTIGSQYDMKRYLRLLKKILDSGA